MPKGTPELRDAIRTLYAYAQKTYGQEILNYVGFGGDGTPLKQFILDRLGKDRNITFNDYERVRHVLEKEINARININYKGHRMSGLVQASPPRADSLPDIMEGRHFWRKGDSGKRYFMGITYKEPSSRGFIPPDSSIHREASGASKTRKTLYGFDVGKTAFCKYCGSAKGSRDAACGICGL